MAESHESLTSLANSSGFLLQLRVEQEVRSTQQRHEYRVAAREHQWRDAATGREGFIDLVLEHLESRIVIECKRVEGSWLFLVPTGAESSPFYSRLLRVARDPNVVAPRPHYDELRITPPTEGAAFCIVRGQADRDRPMLERVAGELIAATEALGIEELQKDPRDAFYRVYVPMIVTNAELSVMRFDPKVIDLSTGRIDVDRAEIQKVPYLRLHKNLSSSVEALPATSELFDLNESKNRTVLIVNVNSLIDWLDVSTIRPPR